MEKDAKWITDAIEEVGKTAIKGNEYWRATYTVEDKNAVAVLKKYMEEAGFETYFDAVGNLFGKIPGKNEKVIMSGSHRDTVRHGGKYDGMLGVLTAIRAAGDLAAELGKPEYTVEVAALCEEETSRFPTSYLGSRHICGTLLDEELNDLDADGISLGDAMKKSGYLQEALSKGRDDLEHFVELHIEQGGVLEYEEKQIGIVTSIVGLLSGEVYLKGHQNHAGTTPMRQRRDPMPVAAEFIYRLNKWAQNYLDDMVCTVGRLEVKPGNVNVIPENVMFTFDIRSSIPERAQEALQVIDNLKKELEDNIEIEVVLPCNEPPTALDFEGTDLLEKVTRDCNLSYKRMVSGAGHDSQIIAQKYKTNMIFVPSVDGISHSTKEFTKTEDIEAGYVVLKEYLKQLAW